MNSALEEIRLNTRVKTVSGETKYAPMVEENENGFEKSIPEYNPNTKSDLMKSINDIAITAFHNAAKESIELGYPINIDLNGLTIKLNPDKTYEIIKTKEKELNIISHIYL